ncbi:MAG: hypothetical protein ACRCZI_10415 [Cetobacterium sp.]
MLADAVPVLNIEVSAVAVTFAAAVQAALQSVISAFKDEPSVTVGDLFVHVAFIPRLVGAGDALTRIVSPGAIRAAVAPFKNVFQRFANDNPSFASLPLSKSK